MTYYTVFAIDLASRRVQIVGSTPHPTDLVMRQVSRTLTVPDGPLGDRIAAAVDSATPGSYAEVEIPVT